MSTSQFYNLPITHPTENCEYPPGLNPAVGSNILSGNKRVYYGLAEGSSISFSCSDGSMLTGPNISICMENGRWNPDPGMVMCTEQGWHYNFYNIVGSFCDFHHLSATATHFSTHIK